MRKQEPACRSIDYSRLGIVISKGLSKSRKGSTTIIRSGTGWIYKHTPSNEYNERIEELRFKNPGISNTRIFKKSRAERINELKERSMNNCAKILSRIILRYNIPWEEK